MEFRRKLYTRGSSFETTVPKPILFAIDLGKKNEVVFKFDAESKRWYIELEELADKDNKEKDNKKENEKIEEEVNNEE